MTLRAWEAGLHGGTVVGYVVKGRGNFVVQ